MFNVVEAMQNLRLSLTGRPDTDSSGLKKEVLLGSPARPPRGPYNSPWTDPTPQSTQTIQNSLDDLDLKPESASCSVSQTHISDLPGEVLSEVFIHVDVLDLLSIALVRVDHLLITKNLSLKYYIEIFYRFVATSMKLLTFPLYGRTLPEACNGVHES